jgi:hypothetical protein
MTLDNARPVTEANIGDSPGKFRHNSVGGLGLLRRSRHFNASATTAVVGVGDDVLTWASGLRRGADLAAAPTRIADAGAVAATGAIHILVYIFATS